VRAGADGVEHFWRSRTIIMGALLSHRCCTLAGHGYEQHGGARTSRLSSGLGPCIGTRFWFSRPTGVPPAAPPSTSPKRPPAQGIWFPERLRGRRPGRRSGGVSRCRAQRASLPCAGTSGLPRGESRRRVGDGEAPRRGDASDLGLYEGSSLHDRDEFGLRVVCGLPSSPARPKRLD